MAPSSNGVDGHQRRRTRTRAVLVQAGVELLVEGRTDVSVQEITARAGVAQGSFYNHFETKEALFEAALDLAMKVYGDARDELVAAIDDPAAVYALSFRVTGRLVGRNPAMARLMNTMGTEVLVHEGGLRPRALQDIRAAVASGRFRVSDVDVAFMSVGAGVLGLARLLIDDPTRDVDVAADQFAEMTLRALGCNEADVAHLMSAQLPEVPDIAALLRLERTH